MEENKKGMFTGFSKVFNFTAAQTVKGKGFKASTIGIGLIVAIIFALISIIMAVAQSDDEKDGDDINSVIDIGESMDIDVFYINNSPFGDGIIEGITSAEAFKNSTFTRVPDSEAQTAQDDANGYLEGKKDALVMKLDDGEEAVNISFYMPYGTEISENSADMLGSAFSSYLDFVRIHEITSLSELESALYGADTFSYSLEAGEHADDLGVMLTKMLVPMLFTLVLYMMILLYGQNITKIVVAEKSSKLMETLLTSVRPYAIISGKILAVSGLAVAQMLIWTAAAVGGYMLGEAAAEAINPGYTNYLSLIIDMISGSSDAFSAGALILAVLTVIIGFLMYSVLAGMVAATVDKMEDLSSVMSLFQLPVIVGFMASYFIQMAGSGIWLDIIRYCPVTSPFCVPSQLLIGDMSILQAAASLTLIIAVTVILVLFTGRIYKGKLFNRH